MKVLVTGATGYIGHKLALSAAEKGYQVHALVRDLNADQRPLHPAIRFFKGDVTDYSSILAAMGGCDSVLHAAALTQLWNKNRSLFYEINVKGTQNMLEAALYCGVKQFVFTSSCAVFGPSGKIPVAEDHPRITDFENDYEVSKQGAEELVRQYARKGLRAMIVNPPRVYGPGLDTKGNPINKMMDRMLRTNKAFMPAAKEVLGNYAYIDDVVEGHFLALEKGVAGERYILGGENVSYQQFFAVVRKVSQQPIRLLAIPKPLLKVGAAFVFAGHYLIGKHTHLSPKTVERLFQSRAVSCEKAVQQLGYKTTPLEVGIEQTIHFLKNRAHAL